MVPNLIRGIRHGRTTWVQLPVPIWLSLAAVIETRCRGGQKSALRLTKVTWSTGATKSALFKTGRNLRFADSPLPVWTPWTVRFVFCFCCLPCVSELASDLCFQTCASRFLTALVDLCKATPRKILESKTLSFSGVIISDLLCKAGLTTNYVSECVVDLGRTQVGEFLEFVNLSISSELSFKVFCQLGLTLLLIFGLTKRSLGEEFQTQTSLLAQVSGTLI